MDQIKYLKIEIYDIIGLVSKIGQEALYERYIKKRN